MDKEMLLKKLMAYNFAAYDWNLYLDTHPYDKKAIAAYAEIVRRGKEIKQEYEAKYGPITASDSASATKWDWIEEPWPWDKQ